MPVYQKKKHPGKPNEQDITIKTMKKTIKQTSKMMKLSTVSLRM